MMDDIAEFYEDQGFSWLGLVFFMLFLEVGRSKILEELLYQSVPQDLNSKVPTTDLVPKGKM